MSRVKGSASSLRVKRQELVVECDPANAAVHDRFESTFAKARSCPYDDLRSTLSELYNLKSEIWNLASEIGI